MSIVIETEGGRVRGVEQDGGRRFYAIPYGCRTAEGGASIMPFVQARLSQLAEILAQLDLQPAHSQRPAAVPGVRRQRRRRRGGARAGGGEVGGDLEPKPAGSTRYCAIASARRSWRRPG